MTQAELDAYHLAGEIESKAYQAGYEAERNVPSNWEEGMPQDYLALLTRQKEVRNQLSRLGEAENGFNTFVPNCGYEGLVRAYPSIADACKGYIRLLRDDPQRAALRAEEEHLERQIRGFERAGSRVAKRREVNNQAYAQATALAKERASQAVLDAHKEALAAGEAAERAMRARVKERQRPIIAQIDELLEREG